MHTTLLTDELIFPEAPRWHQGALHFSDLYGHEVLRVGLDGKPETVAVVPGQPSGLGWLPDGRLLVVSMLDRRLLRLDPSGLTEVADLSPLTGFHINDMVVDTVGRAYIGNTGFDYMNRKPLQPGDLIAVEPDGRSRKVASDLLFPNGTVITPDGRTLVVAETFGKRLTAFDIEADGSLSGRRVWADLGDLMPDGICLDAAGAIWAATLMANAVVRVEQGGRIAERIDTDINPTACALGGPDGSTLFITSRRMQAPGAERNGRIETVRVAVGAVGAAGSARAAGAA